MKEHVRDDLEAYALGALGGREAEAVARHIVECEWCRREASSLAQVVGSLPDTVRMREPRAILRDRVIAATRADAAIQTHARGDRLSLGRVRAAPLALASLTAAVIVLGAVELDASRQLAATTAERDEYAAIVEQLRQGARTWYMVGKDDFAGSGGTLFAPRADGQPPFVLFHDLPAIPPSKVLTIWLVSPDGTWARAAAFTPSGRDVQAVRVTMDVTGFDRCAVTLESSSSGPRYGAVVMESRIAPRAGP